MPETLDRRCVPFGTLDRRTILGASEIAPVLGMSRYYTALAIYAAKKRDDEQMIDRSAAKGVARWGQRLEAVIRAAYQEEVLQHTPFLMRDGDTDIGTVLHPEHPWRAASPDGVVVDEAGEWQWGLECKNVDRSQAPRWGDVGSDEIPDEYALQCQWGMHVTGLDRWDVACLIGGNDFRVYTLRRDDALLADVVAAMDAFWTNHVLADVPPEPTAEDNDLLSRILKQRSDAVVENDPTIDALAEAVRSARAAAAPVIAACDLAEARLKAAIGDRAGAIGPWGKLSFRQNKPSMTTDWKAVARDAGATEFQIAAHTAERTGARPFRLTFTGE